MISSAKLQEAIDQLWTMNDMTRIFDRTVMTINLWRRDKDLPAIVIKGTARPTIRFSPQDVRRWAKKNEIQMYDQ